MTPRFFTCVLGVMEALSKLILVFGGNRLMRGLVPINIHCVLFAFNIKPLAEKYFFARESVISALSIRSGRASTEPVCTS